MSTEVMETIRVVGYIVLGFLALYLKTKESLKEKVSGVIAEAEDFYIDSSKAGGKKLNYAIDHLYRHVPVVLKPFITRDVVESIVQTAFDTIESYAVMQLDRLTNKAVK